MLFLGARIAGVDVGFWKSFVANLGGTVRSLLVAFFIWGVLGIGFAFVDRGFLEQMEFGKLVLGAFSLVVAVGFLQFLVYLGSVRRSFDIGFIRAFGVCLLAALLHLVFAVSITPVVSGAAIGL